MFGIDHLFASGFGLLTILTIGLQLFCLVHIVRTGRPWYWFWIIMWLPVLGALAYLFLEMKPGMGKINWQSLRWRFTSPERRLAIRQEVFDNSPTIKNRYRLAEQLLATDSRDRALSLLEEGRRGAFTDDPELIMNIGEVQLECQKPEEALANVRALGTLANIDWARRAALVEARAVGMLNGEDEARGLFDACRERKRSEAPEYYFAEFLVRRGESSEAREVLQGIVRRYKKGTAVWRYREERWFLLARQLLKTLNKTS